MINTVYSTECSDQITYAGETGHSSGDPVLADGVTPGVAVGDSTTNGTTVLVAPGAVVNLSVQAVNDSGNIVMAAGDTVYYSFGDTIVLNGKTSGIPYGILLEGIALGATDTSAPVRLLPTQVGASAGGSAGGQGTHVVFTENPTVTGAAGGASVGTDNAVNIVRVNGEVFEYQNNGTQTIVGPSLTSGGLLVSLDLTNDEGATFDQGITALSKAAYVAGTDPVSLKITFTVADVSGLDVCWFGWRKLAARNDDPTAYTDFAFIGPISGDIKMMTDLNGSGSATTTDSTQNWADAETHTLEVNVSAAGVVSYKIDGAAPTVSPTATFTFDSGDTIIPVFQFLHAATTPGAITWKEYHCDLAL